MKPTGRKVRPHSNYASAISTTSFGTNHTISKVQGSVKNLGVIYTHAIVSLFDKKTGLLLASRKADDNGGFLFLGLNNEMVCFLICFDLNQEQNSLILDLIIPK